MNTLNQSFDTQAAAATSIAANAKIGSLLVNRGKLSRDDFKNVIAFQQEQDLRFGDAARRLGLVTTEDVTSALEEQFGYTVTANQTEKLHPQVRGLIFTDSPRAEALRSLRSELLLRYFGHTDQAVQTNYGHDELLATAGKPLALVGTESAESIAMTCAQLGLMFARLGLRTLLVDSNLRSPQLHKLFGISERDPGLTDLIASRRPAIPQSPLRFLYLLTAGTQVPNPQELLAQRNCAEQLQRLAADYDVTLVSTAPQDGVIDAQLVASSLGAALVVVNQDVSRLAAVSRLCHSLQSNGVRLLGAALHQ
jgi:protein-tyrosine kinase